jgi:hypothetical protein
MRGLGEGEGEGEGEVEAELDAEEDVDEGEIGITTLSLLLRPLLRLFASRVYKEDDEKETASRIKALVLSRAAIALG